MSLSLVLGRQKQKPPISGRQTPKPEHRYSAFLAQKDAPLFINVVQTNILDAIVPANFIHGISYLFG